MSFLLRVVRQGRWYGALTARDRPLPGDPLGDLITSENRLSLWALDDQHANLPAVVTAIAATRTNVSNVDVALAPTEAVAGLGLAPVKSPGDTPVAQARDYHCDLTELTARDVVAIGEAIRDSGEFRRYSEREVRDLLAAAVSARSLDPRDLKQGIRDELSKRGLIDIA